MKLHEGKGKKIGVAFVLPSLEGGGAERVAVNLLAGLDRLRFNSELVVMCLTGPLRDAVPPEVQIHDLGRPRLRYGLPALIRALRHIKPAVTFSTLGYVNLALLACRSFLPKTCIIVREANTPSQSLPHTPYPRLMRAAYARLYRRADAVLCQHSETAHEMVYDFQVPPERVKALPNPVNVAAVRAGAAKLIREPGAGLRFVAAGRLTRQKGFDRLLDMLAALPAEAHLTIYGEGPDERNLKAQGRALGIESRVQFGGFVKCLPSALAGADALLLPSRWEGVPNVVLEALACGTPVIATPEAGGLAELARNTPAGAVTVAQLPEGFLSAMRGVRARTDKQLRPSMLPQQFDASVVVNTFARLLEDLYSSCPN